MKAYNIAIELAPKQWSKFVKWHKQCCPTDPLTARERFIKIGYKPPKKRSNENRRAEKKIE